MYFDHCTSEEGYYLKSFSARCKYRTFCHCVLVVTGGRPILIT
jgi:hypothetical protein